ncbi:MAG: LacI family transcriptional regulator [Paraglaciecola sp.]|nr:LacI family transcriptional regulator [Paraglaciecola sp.]NCT49019.1 LacI family transcriptional regulator [Paraglaciecola sp.]
MTIKIRTLSDLAKVAGVSESTASRALNNNSLIAQKTRTKIQELAAQHDFKINAAARNFRLQKTNTIAVVIIKSSELDQSITDPFVLSIVGVIAEELRQHGYDVLLVSHNVNSPACLADYFNMKRADGLIVFGQGDDIDKFDQLIDQQHPIVVWGAQSDKRDYITVGTDNKKGGYLATSHLLQQGYRRIVFAGVLSYETNQRYQGYCQALQEARHTVSAPLDIHFNYDNAYHVTQNMLQQNNFHFDGIIAASDTIALGMIRALNEADISVPEKVAVVGYDDISVAAFTQPSLSSIRQDTFAGGKALVNSLLKLLNNEEVTSTLLTTELVIRHSSVRV